MPGYGVGPNEPQPVYGDAYYDSYQYERAPAPPANLQPRKARIPRHLRPRHNAHKMKHFGGATRWMLAERAAEGLPMPQHLLPDYMQDKSPQEQFREMTNDERLAWLRAANEAEKTLPGPGGEKEAKRLGPRDEPMGLLPEDSALMDEVFPIEPRKHYELQGFEENWKPEPKWTTVDEPFLTRFDRPRQKHEPKVYTKSIKWVRGRRIARAAESAVYGKGSVSTPRVIACKNEIERKERNNNPSQIPLRLSNFDSII